MIIKLHGETSLNKLPKIIKEVVTDIQQRAGIDEEKYTVKDAELGILFNVKGEKMMLSSEIDGMIEPFIVHVQLDEKGNVVKTKDNENESMLDDFTKAISKGEAIGNDPIESLYNSGDLEEYHTEEGGDLKAVYYNVKGSNEGVLRYFRNGILVGETGYKQKEA